MSRWIFPLAVGAMWLSGSLARADVFLLEGGGRLEGRLLNPDQDPRTDYAVQTPFGAQVVIQAERVKQVQKDSQYRQRYEEFMASLPDTAEAHWDMAQRCAQAGLKDERTYHLQRVLTLEPDHTAARHALGYSQVGDNWVKTEDFRRNQGYIRFRGDWRLQQEKELMEQEEDREEEVNEWKKKLRMWRSWLVKGRGREAEALAEIRAIDRRRAAPALAELLKEEGEDPRLKALYIEVLAKLQSQVGVGAFIDRALNDPDAAIRDRCLDALASFGREAALAPLTKALKDDDNVMVNRGAAGLARLGDENSTQPLIEALTTRHKQVISTGSGNLGVGFGKGGLGGLSAGGGGPKVIEHEVRNQAVLAALTTIHPGVNFAFDKARWRGWYAEQNTPSDVNLHRLD